VVARLDYGEEYFTWCPTVGCSHHDGEWVDYDGEQPEWESGDCWMWSGWALEAEVDPDMENGDAPEWMIGDKAVFTKVDFEHVPRSMSIITSGKEYNVTSGGKVIGQVKMDGGFYFGEEVDDD